jgi:DNA anti-recombination protein RmuC
MDILTSAIFAAAAGLMFGSILVWLYLRGKLERASIERSALEAQLASERAAAAEKLNVIQDAQTRLGDAFRALSAEALQTNNQAFLDLAKTALGQFQEAARGDLARRQQAIDELVKPIRESLAKVDTTVQALEVGRASAYAALLEQVKSLAETQQHLDAETGNLVKALRAPCDSWPVGRDASSPHRRNGGHGGALRFLRAADYTVRRRASPPRHDRVFAGRQKNCR